MAPNASDDWTSDPSIQEWLSTPEPGSADQPPRNERPQDQPVADPVVDLDRLADSPQAYSDHVDPNADTAQWAASFPETDQPWAVPTQPPVAQPRPHTAAPAYGADFDANAFRVQPKRRLGSRLRDTFSSRSVVVATALVVLAVAVLAIGFAVSGGDTGDEKDAAGEGIAIPPVSSSAPAAPANADADCPNKTDGPVTTGRDAGGTDSGPGVIKAFDHAYYVDRSGAKARSVVTPAGKTGTAQQIQAGIDRLDPETLHCLKITDKGTGLYAVELSEIAPRGGAPNVYHQLVQTSVADGKTWIVSIEKDPSITD